MKAFLARRLARDFLLQPGTIAGLVLAAASLFKLGIDADAASLIADAVVLLVGVFLAGRDEAPPAAAPAEVVQ